METGTEILLQRMKDYPEEFVFDNSTGTSKWERIIGDARDYLPKEDIEALDAGYKQVRVDLFNERVLKKLAGEEPISETITYKAKERYAGGFTDARGLFGGAVAKAEGTFVGTLQDHAAQHHKMVQEREEQIQKEMKIRGMQNAMTTGSSYPYEVNPAQNAVAGGWWTK